MAVTALGVGKHQVGNPTRKPRINLVVEPEVYETIRAIASSQHRSAASIVMELVTGAYPLLVQLRRTLDKAAALPPEARPAALQAVVDVEESLQLAADVTELGMDALEHAVTPTDRSEGA